MANQPTETARGFIDQLPTDQLKHELRELLKTAGKQATQSLVKSVAGKASGLVEQLPGGEMVKKLASGGGVKEMAGIGIKQAGKKVKEAVTGGDGDGDGSSGGSQAKVTNVVEEIDVGVPINVAYDQWTRFTDFPSFMKKVENVEQVSDTELSWRTKIFWSSRNWKSTILEQVPDDRIIWRSEGAKGYVDGAVTFHKLAPNLTRILLVLEYYPSGFFEKTGNLWRAGGRRTRLELKHFRRHVMTHTTLHQDELKGWRGEIHDSEVQEQTEETDESTSAQAQSDSEQSEESKQSEESEQSEEPKKSEQPEESKQSEQSEQSNN